MTCAQIAAVLAIEQAVGHLDRDVALEALCADRALAARFTKPEITLGVLQAAALGRLDVADPSPRQEPLR